MENHMPPLVPPYDIARVYIIELPYAADKLYEYSVPAELYGMVHEGLLVSVPFGGGNRHLQAVVWEMAYKPLYNKKTKPVFSVIWDVPVLDEKQRRLCEFLKRHTLCTMGEAVKSVLPAAVLSQFHEVIKLGNKDYDVSSKKLSTKSLAILTYIRENSPVTRLKLKAHFGEDISDELIALTKLSLISRTVDISRGLTIKKFSYVSLNVPNDDIRSILDGDTNRIRLRSQNQKKVLEVLLKNGEMSVESVYEQTGCTRVHINALRDKGLIKTREEQVYRNPYAEIPPRDDDLVLSEEQSAAYDKLNELYSLHEPKAALLFGVTGSGKTSVIKKMIDRVRADGRGVIMLVPEIALTPQAVAVFCGYYGNSVSVLHSKLSAGERLDAWQKIREGESDIVIGTRSAVMAPLNNIGLIIIDEEQEHTYKSDSDPKYSAHDVASFRCGEENAMLLLASATPSLASYYKAKSGKYTLVEMTKRYGGATLPTVKICDMRREIAAGNVSPISVELISSLNDTVENGKQAIVFLNRRGYNSSVVCISCGESIKCPNCSVSMTYHLTSSFGRDTEESVEKRKTRSGYLICHYCGYREKVPVKCPACGKENFKYTGFGTQLVEEQINKLIPKASVVRLDMDTATKKRSHSKILETFRSEKANILLGTQMVAKGHDFPNVTLVGVLGADSALYLDDYRAAERTFSMLTQVIGRAGRKSGNDGVAVVQTLYPDSDVIRYAAIQDYKSFYEREIRFRKNLAFPPFCDLAVFTISSSDESVLGAAAERLSMLFKEKLQNEYKDLKLQAFGPFENPIFKVQNVCRMRLVIKCRLTKRFRNMASEILTEYGNGVKMVNLSVDFNPNKL